MSLVHHKILVLHQRATLMQKLPSD